MAFDRACIPVLLTYDSKVIAKFDKNCEEYIEEITNEFDLLYKRFIENISDNVPLTVHLFLLPLKTKADLISCFDGWLKQLQCI